MKKNQKYTSLIQFGKNLLIVLGMFLLSQVGTTLITFSLTSKIMTKNTPFITSIIILILIANIAIMVKIAKKLNILQFNFNFLTKTNVKWIIYIFLVARIAVIALSVLLEMQGQNNTKNDELLLMVFQSAPKIIIFLTIAIAAPILEEIVFRGCIMGLLLKNYPKTGLIVSSILFASLHSPTDLLTFIIYFILGFSLGFAYYKTNRLESSMSVHFLNNLPGAVYIMFAHL